MSALGMASLGTQCEDPALGMSSLGVHCSVVVVVQPVGGGAPFWRKHEVKDPDEDIPLDYLVREDEELLAVIIAGVQIGIIK